MAEWLNFNGETDNETDENSVIQFEHASYLNQFDVGYDPNEDPEFEDPEGLQETLDQSEYDDEVDFEEESKLRYDDFEDTQLCFKGKEKLITWTQDVSLGPCDHMCCKVWHLEPIQPTNTYLIMETFLKHHGESSGNKCSDKECNNPNATRILARASLLARASKIFTSHTSSKMNSKAKAFNIC